MMVQPLDAQPFNAKSVFSAQPALGTTGESLVAVQPTGLRAFFAFPNPVNEYAARFTAGLVVLLSLGVLLGGWGPGLVLIAVGFILRVLWGPKVSPLALLSVKVLAPRIGPAKLVPGPPKRFAQGMGAVMSIGAAVAFFAGLPVLAWIILGFLIFAASLEAFLGLCLGCVIFGFLQRRGIIPRSVCEACADFTALKRN